MLGRSVDVVMVLSSRPRFRFAHLQRIACPFKTKMSSISESRRAKFAERGLLVALRTDDCDAVSNCSRDAEGFLSIFLAAFRGVGVFLKRRLCPLGGIARSRASLVH